MELLRSSSPDLGDYKLSGRRHTLQVQSREDLLTSSLPSSTLKSAFSALRDPAKVEDTFVGSIEIDEELSSFYRSHSSGVKQRPRSASVYGSNHSMVSLGKKGLLRNLSRSRPSSASVRNSKNGSGRPGSVSGEQEANIGAQKVEIAFAQIKNQLDQLSKEDKVLQERLDHLASEIAFIQRYTVGTRIVQQQNTGGMPQAELSQGTTSLTPPFLMVSDKPVHVHPGDISPLDGDSWEETKKHQDSPQDLLSPHHQRPSLLLDSAYRCDFSTNSLGSCGSLADSEGSLSPNTQTTCSIVVVDHDCHSGGQHSRFTIPSTYEDDVFFS